MSYRLAGLTAENVDLVVEVLGWIFLEDCIALEEAVVVGDVDS